MEGKEAQSIVACELAAMFDLCMLSTLNQHYLPDFARHCKEVAFMITEAAARPKAGSSTQTCTVPSSSAVTGTSAATKCGA